MTHRWREKLIVAAFMVLALQNLLWRGPFLNLSSSPFFEVFSSSRYVADRTFRLTSNEGREVEVPLSIVLREVSNRNPVLATTVWHLFKFAANSDREFVRYYMRGIFCRGYLGQNPFGLAGVDRAVYTSASEGVTVEQSCR